MTTLRADRLAVRNKRFTLVEVTFTLEEGDILGLIGRSGSGKSTLLKALIGEFSIESGQLSVTHDEKEVDFHDALGYSPQDHALFENLTVRENYELFGQLRGMTRRDITDRAESLLSRLRLDGAKDKRLTELSGGMRKRADLLVALLHNPPILLLDEPFTGLDIALTDFIWELLKELSKEGKIIILSSHNIDEVEEHCNKFGLVRDGRFYNTKQILEKTRGEKSQVSEYIRYLFTKDAMEEIER